jgi:acyl-CoA thioesterase
VVAEPVATPPSHPRPFADAVALRSVGEGRFEAIIVSGWDVRGIPHGGYLLALVGAAAGEVGPQRDPLSVAATYLQPPEVGPADLLVETVRGGRRQSTFSVRLVQGGRERVRAVVTMGTIDPVDGPVPVTWGSDTAPPGIPGPDECLSTSVLMQAEGEEVALHRNLELRLHPDTGWVQERPSGHPQVEGWLRLADGSDADLLTLLLFSDGMPPSLFEATGRHANHVPTVQLTTHLFARPRPGWVQIRCRTRVRAGSFVDEDADLWDAEGRLVATSRQLALVR